MDHQISHFMVFLLIINCLLIPQILEKDMDMSFRAVGEATEEAVLNSLVTAEAVVGRDGNMRLAFKDLIEEFNISLF
jgi:D-aminopeptidase